MATPINIDAAHWTLFDKIMYGGLGYGSFTLPANFFKLIIAICFPPLGQVINIIGDQILSYPPFITLDALKLLLQPDSITKIIYSFLYTTFFYIPGLIYVLGNIADTDSAPLT